MLAAPVAPPSAAWRWTCTKAQPAPTAVSAVVYAIIFGAGIWYILKLLRVGPVKQPPKDTRGGEKTPARPLSMPDESTDQNAPGTADGVSP